MAARAVDEKRIAELRSAVVSALTGAGLLLGGDAILISPGQDPRISISLKVDAANPNDCLSDLATRIAAVLTYARLRLVAPSEPRSKDTAERLARGETCKSCPSRGGYAPGLPPPSTAGTSCCQTCSNALVPMKLGCLDHR